MTVKKRQNPGARKTGKKQLPLVAAAVLLTAMLVYLAVGIGANGATGKGSSSSAAAGQAPSGGSGGSESPAASSGGSSGCGVKCGASAPAPSSGPASSDDGYVLPADPPGSAQSSSQEVSSSVFRKPDRRESSENPFSSSLPGSARADGSGPEISREEFDSLQTGMTYEEVEAAVGGPGTLQTDSGKTRIYKWRGAGSSDSYAQLTFKSGKLAYLFQFGL